MIKEKLVRYLLLSALIFAFVLNSTTTDAQIIIFPKNQKKSSPVIFFPEKNEPVKNRKNLPPGQAKKIYGEKSAKRFAPGQRKKAHYNTSPYYNKENEKGKHGNHPGNKKHEED